MKKLRLFLFVLTGALAIPQSLDAKDTIGAYNEDGYYVAGLPWSESFDNFGGNYDGNSQLPNGWLATGDTPFVTATSAQIEAITGSYYMVTPSVPTQRNDRAYTPFFRLKAGSRYTFSFHLWMPGDSYYQTTSSLTLTVGKEQDYEFHTQKLLSVEGQSVSSWTEYSVQYTPEEDGLYCFCFQLSAPAFGGYAGVEDVSLLADNQIMPPTADFALDGNVNLMYEDYMQFPETPLHLTSLSKDAESFEWSMPECIPSSSTEENPEVCFPETGHYTISLTVRNRCGEQTCEQTFTVGNYKEEEAYVGIRNYSGYTDKTLTRGEVPCYTTDAQNDFVTGPNHYYRTMAERFEIPSYQEIDISSLGYMLTNFSFITSTSSTPWPVQKEVPITVTVVGEKNGLPDEDHVFGSLTGPLKTMIADRGIGVATMKEFRFAEPVRVKGTFYVVLSFPEEFLIDSPDLQIGRSYFAMSPCLHRSGRTTMYVKPHHDFDGSEMNQGWMLASDFHRDMRGYGLAYFVMCSTLTPNLDGIEPFIPNGIDSAAATSDLTYAGFTLSGRLVNKSNAHGIYISNNKKIIVR